MTDSKHEVVPAGEAPSTDGKRPYCKPEIAEEESFETCAILACGLKQGQPTSGCRASPRNS